MSWHLVQNSLLLSGTTTVLCLSAGFIGAVALTGFPRRLQRVAVVAAICGLMLPPFLVINCWMDLAGVNGRWRDWLPFDLYGMPGAIGIMTLLYWPITLCLVWSAWRRLERSHLETDVSLASGSLVRWILWPMTARALGLSAVVTFVLALNHFTIPALLQVKVLPAMVWIQFNTTFQYLEAFLQGWPLLVGPLFLIALVRTESIPWPRREEAVSPRLLRDRLGPAWMMPGSVILVVCLAMSVGLPASHLIFNGQTWQDLPGVITTTPGPLWSSFWLPAVTASGSLLLAMLTWRCRWFCLLWVPFLIPGVALGIVLLAGRNAWTDWVYRNESIVILAWTLRYAAPCWFAVRYALKDLDPELTDTARLTGAGLRERWRHLYWPQAGGLLMVAWYLVYLLCLWDVETMILVVPPGGETLAMRVFNLLHYGHTSHVNAMCLLLLALALLPLLIRWPAKWLRLTPLLAGLLVVSSGCTGPDADDVIALDSKLFSHVKVIGSRGNALGQFNKPRSVAVDREDNLYVIDFTGRVQKFSPEGEFLLAWHMPEIERGKPKGMHRDPEGNIMIVEPHYGRVNHFSTNGTLVTQWGERGTNAGQLIMPRDAAITPSGLICVSEYTFHDWIQVFALTNKSFLFHFGQRGSGPGEFRRPEGLATDASNRIYVADAGNHRIQVFSQSGQWLYSYGTPGNGLGELSYPYDIHVDTNGIHFVCEFGNSRIQVFDAGRTPLETIGELGYQPGQFHNPWGVAMDSAGNLYVADSRNHRIQKLIRRR